MKYNPGNFYTSFLEGTALLNIPSQIYPSPLKIIFILFSTFPQIQEIFEAHRRYGEIQTEFKTALYRVLKSIFISQEYKKGTSNYTWHLDELEIHAHLYLCCYKTAEAEEWFLMMAGHALETPLC